MIINSKNLFKMLPDLVLIDTDNTMYDYAPCHKAGLNSMKVAMKKKLSLSDLQFEEIYIKSRKIIKKKLKGTASSHNRILYIQKMLELMGLGSQVFLAVEYEQIYWRSFLSKAVLFDNLTDFLDDLRLYNIPSVIVTDLTAKIQFRKIIYFQLDKYFDNIVTSEEAGFDKPHKSPFLLAIEKSKPKGNNIWMIGDNPINDIEGAKKAINAITLQKKHKGVLLGKGKYKPDLIFDRFLDLRKLLKSLQKNND